MVRGFLNQPQTIMTTTEQAIEVMGHIKYDIVPTKNGLVKVETVNINKPGTGPATHLVETTEPFLSFANKLGAVKVLWEVTGIGLKASKTLIEKSPGVLIYQSHTFCENLAAKLMAVGVNVNVREI